MQVRARTNASLVALFISPALLALPALAGTPAALDRVPTDAQAVIVVPNLGGLLNDINTINAFMGDQASPEVMLVTSMIRGTPGINLAGSMAAVMDFGNGQPEPETVFLIPVSDFEAFTQGRKAEDGVVQYPFPDGQVMFTRDAGDGYAVFGEDADDVRGFDAKGGQSDAHTKQLGKAGGRIADANDIFIFVNLAQFGDQIAQGLGELEAQGDMVEMMGGAEAARGYDQMTSALRTLASDALSISMGVNFDQASGFAFDMGLQFKEGSDSASYLNNEGNAGQYFAHVPQMDYFYAAACDMSGAGIQKLMGEYMDWATKMDTTGALAEMNVKPLISGFDGGVQVLGASDNIMGGLLNNMLYYAHVNNPGAYIDAVRSSFDNMGDSAAQLAQQGIKVNATLDAQPTEIDGVKAYGYSFSMDMTQMNNNAAPAMGGANPAMIMQMMFGGAGGPSGYIAQTGEHGLLTTVSRDAALFSKAAKAAKGADGQDTMSTSASIKKTASMLPSNRVMEAYIGADHLVNTAGPMLMMFGVIPEFEPLNALPPLGMGLTADGGGLLLRTVFPNETVHAMLKMVPQEAWDSMNRGDNTDDGDDGMDF